MSEEPPDAKDSIRVSGDISFNVMGFIMVLTLIIMTLIIMTIGLFFVPIVVHYSCAWWNWWNPPGSGS